VTKKTRSITETKETWQESYAQELTHDDAVEITDNIVGFFSMLQEWEQEQGNTNERNPGGVVDA
jgi:hypothetical protein